MKPRFDLDGRGTDELRRIAGDHLTSMMDELRGVRADAREKINPLNIIRDHPVATAAVAGIGGFLLYRLMRTPSTPAPANRGEDPRPTVAGTFARSMVISVAGMAGRAAPSLALGWWMRRQAAAVSGADGPREEE